MFYGDDVSIITHSPFRIPQFIGCFTLYGQFLRILFIYILALRIFQVFLQTDPALTNLCRSFFSHIAVMPYLFGHIGNVRLISGVAEDKAVFIAVFLEPEVNVVSSSVDIHSKP